MQFIENLPDRQAADAVRGRIDWKYALGLELSDPGFDFSVLSEFRQRLLNGGRERLLFDRILERGEAKGLLKGKRRQRTDSTHVLGAVRQLSVVERLGETVRRSLDTLARVAPTWLAEHLQPEWSLRYGRRFEGYQLPKVKAALETLSQTIGHDGFVLLDAVWHPEAPVELRQLPMIELMRRIWIQRFYRDLEQIQLRTKKRWGRLPSKHLIVSLDDLDATYCLKRATEWIGYRVHLTETCVEEEPRLITQVETTTAAQHDSRLTRPIQQDLQQRGLAPQTHLVDEGYMEAEILVQSQDAGIDLVGPLPSRKSWQGRDPEAFDHSHFEIDWQQQVATCPAGHQSVKCVPREMKHGHESLCFTFASRTCRACEVRARCTRAKTAPRTLTLYRERAYRAQEEARARQQTPAYEDLYAKRAGIEGTLSQGVRRAGMRSARYLGLSRTRLQHLATASAINVVRAVNWLTGEVPEATRISPFQALVAELA